jgi:hypothetical protein
LKKVLKGQRSSLLKKEGLLKKKGLKNPLSWMTLTSSETSFNPLNKCWSWNWKISVE